MPYAKKGMRRRRYRRRPRTAYGLAKAAYAKAKKAQVQKELKFNQFGPLTDTSPDSTGSIEELSQLSQGDTNNTREGNVIYPTSLKWRATLDMATAATDTYVRIVIFRWLSGSPSAVTDVLNTVGMTSFKDDNNRFRSQILYDKVINLNDAKSTSIFLQGRIKLRGLIAYDETTAAANKNSIWIATMSNEAVNFPSFAFRSQMYFRDS